MSVSGSPVACFPDYLTCTPVAQSLLCLLGLQLGGWGEPPGTGQASSRNRSERGGKVLSAPPPGRAGQALHTYFASEKKSGGILLRLFVGYATGQGHCAGNGSLPG